MPSPNKRHQRATQVPLNTIALSTLPRHIMTQGTVIRSLMRNLGGSVGISILVPILAQNTQAVHSRLVEDATEPPPPSSCASGNPEISIIPSGPLLFRRGDEIGGGINSFTGSQKSGVACHRANSRTYKIHPAAVLVSGPVTRTGFAASWPLCHCWRRLS